MEKENKERKERTIGWYASDENVNNDGCSIRLVKQDLTQMLEKKVVKATDGKKELYIKICELSGIVPKAPKTRSGEGKLKTMGIDPSKLAEYLVANPKIADSLRSKVGA